MAVDVTQQLRQINALTGLNGVPTLNIAADNALLHELQLGEQLNHCVIETRRADFSLMLAMLTEDVREQSQFLVPQPQETTDTVYTNSSMRKELNLPNIAPIALTSLEDIAQFNQAEIIKNNAMASLQLANAIQPKPLAFRDDSKHISNEIMGNTSLFTQLKHKQAQSQIQANDSLAEESTERVMKDKPLSKAFNFNAKGWLEGIQETIVKAPLVA